jgi:CBS domain-containing protein
VSPDGLSASLSEVARFLARRPPFNELAPEELGEVVAETEIEFHLAGSLILTEDGGPVTNLRVIHSGAVDLVHDGSLLDLLGPGDTLGHGPMLAGMPPGFEARAAEDTLCYRIPVAVARPLLERARRQELSVGTGGPGHQAVARMIRSPAVRCDPEEPIGEVARRMTEIGANSAIIDLPGGEFGILTDRDLRERVVAAGVPSSAPVRLAMTAPVFSVTPDRLAGEVLFELLERGHRHAPVVADGRLIGVVEDADLFAVQPRSWFGARRAIARATGVEGLVAVAERLTEITLDLHTSNLRGLEVARVRSALIDALTVRALELAAEAHGLPADGVVWVALSSHARRELTPASPPMGALACSDDLAPGFLAAARATLTACGLPATMTLRSPAAWAAADREDELAAFVLWDRRPLFGTPREPLPAIGSAARDAWLGALLARALARRPPTGFDAGAVIWHGGERSDELDIQAAATGPIAAMALWAGAAAGMVDGSTTERLAAGAAAGALSGEDASTLIDAFELAFELRIGHHLEQLAAGLKPDERLRLSAMSPLARDHLRDVFRAVTSVQRALSERAL